MLENIFKSAVTYHGKKEFDKAKELYEDLLKKVRKTYHTSKLCHLLSEISEFSKADQVFKNV